jgi:hypothetical protein
MIINEDTLFLPRVDPRARHAHREGKRALVQFLGSDA